MSAVAAPTPARLGVGSGGRALVTGASGAIGVAFARALAARGVDLLLTAARALAARGVDLLLTARPQESERLHAIAAELAARHGVHCATAGVDLSRRDGADQLRVTADRLRFQVDLLVNSAGLGAPGPFVRSPPDMWSEIVHVNVEAVVHLTRLFVGPMIARRSGAVVHVASTAAVEPQPYFAVYAASKAFVLSFGQALWAECRLAGVRVTTVCSGPVRRSSRSEHNAAGEANGFLHDRRIAPERVADRALRALLRDEPTVVLRVDGLARLYAPMSCVRSVLPLATRLRLSERVNRWLYNGAAAATPVSSSDTIQSRSAVTASRLAGEDGSRAPSEK